MRVTSAFVLLVTASTVVRGAQDDDRLTAFGSVPGSFDHRALKEVLAGGQEGAGALRGNGQGSLQGIGGVGQVRRCVRKQLTSRLRPIKVAMGVLTDEPAEENDCMEELSQYATWEQAAAWLDNYQRQAPGASARVAHGSQSFVDSVDAVMRFERRCGAGSLESLEPPERDAGVSFSSWLEQTMCSGQLEGPSAPEQNKLWQQLQDAVQLDGQEGQQQPLADVAETDIRNLPYVPGQFFRGTEEERWVSW